MPPSRRAVVNLYGEFVGGGPVMINSLGLDGVADSLHRQSSALRCKRLSRTNDSPRSPQLYDPRMNRSSLAALPCWTHRRAA